MPTLAIVQCGQRKIWDTRPDTGPTAAKDAYVSPYFKKNRAYAERFADRWVILSAKYGFLQPNTKIQNYDITFRNSASKPIFIGDLKRQVKRMKLNGFGNILVLGGSKYATVIRKAFDDAAVVVRLPFKKFRGIGYIQQAVGIALKSGRPLRD